MIIKEFQCKKCNRIFTIETSMNNANEIYCECGSKNLRRIYSSTFQLKGPGFYKNDYAKIQKN